VSASVKIATFVGAIFLSLGIYLPFFPIWLEAQRFSPGEIAFLLSVPLSVKVVVTPFLVAFSGRLPQRRTAAAAYCGVATLAFVAIALNGEFWITAVLLGVFGAFWHALIPLGDSLALREVRRHGANYGTIRLWGSITFILANVAAGYLLGLIGVADVHFLIVMMLILALASAFVLPSYGIHKDERPRSGLTFSGGFGAFLKKRPFMAMALSAGFLQASHALLYGFGTIDWVGRGYSMREIGAFWAMGVIAEVLLFTRARWLFKYVRPHRLVMLGGAAAVLRWSLHAEVDGFWLIVLIQCLHGLSFGATHLGMQSFLAGSVSEADTPSAQGVMVLLSGIAMALLTLACGALYATYAGRAFYAMAGISLVGLGVLFFLRYPQSAGEGG